MPMTPGNKLYLYRLLRDAMGVGRQTMLSHVEEILEADDLMPSDVGCADTRELLEQLDFVRLTVFKRGRIYATVIAQPELDELLERAITTSDKDTKAPAAAGKRRSWKRKKSAKDVRPAKPRPKDRVKPDVEKAEADADAEPQATAAKAERGPRADASSDAAAVSGTAVSPAAATAPGIDAASRLDASMESGSASEPQAVTEPQVPGDSQAATEPQVPGESRPDPSVPAFAPAPSVSTELQGATSRQATSAKSSAPESKATSNTMAALNEEAAPATKLQITYDPGQPTTEPGEKQLLENAASEGTASLRQTSEAQAAPTPEQQITPTAAAQQQSAHTSEAVTVAQPSPAITSEPAPTPEAVPMPQSVSAITPEPATRVAPDSTWQTTSVSAPMPESQQRPIPHQAPTRPIPHSFFREVWCPSDVLGALYEVLPLDVNPLTLLDEDWTVARATNSFEQTARGVAYPLRCLSTSEGTPVRAHLHRQGPTASGKHWQLAHLDGISQDAFVDLGGLPANNEGAWTDLDGMPTGAYRPTSPLREFSQFALIGSWAETLPELEQLAEPEPWGPGLENLREYFLVTFHRAKSQGRIGVSANKQHAAFDTGLLTKDAQPIYACFDVRDDSIAWQLESFSTTTRLEKDPEPATYVSSLSHLCLVAPHAVRLSRPVRKTYGEALDTPIARAMLRAQRNHRVATPAYDPQTEELRLLLPLASRDPSTIDRAVVLADLGDGDYEARAVLSLDRARVCARVVTSDLPAWLR